MKVVLKSKGDGLNVVPDFNQEIEVEGSTTLLDITSLLDDDFEGVICVLSEDKVFKSFKGNETLSDYLENQGMVLEDGLVFLALPFDTYETYHPSSAEEEEDDDESEGTDSEGDNTPRSRDGSEESDDEDKDDKPDKGGYGGKQTSGTGATSSTDLKTQNPEPDFFDKHFLTLVSQAKTKQDFLDIQNKAEKMFKFYYDQSVSARNRYKKMVSEERKQKTAEEKAKNSTTRKAETAAKKVKVINLTVKCVGRGDIKVQIANGETLLTLKEKVGQSLGLSKSKCKAIVLSVNDKSYPKDNNRKLVGSIFEDGSVITMTSTGQGGGKRSSKTDTGINSKDERVIALKENINTVLLRLSINSGASPAIDEMAKNFNDIVSGVDKDPENVFSLLVQGFDKTMLMKIISGFGSSANSKAKFGAVSQAIFDNSLTPIREVKQQVSLIETTLASTVEMMIVSQFSDSAGNIDWGTVSKFLTDKVASLPKEETTTS